MDEGLLNDLLECSVCLERLDTSSRVLPCQHTFCLKCLKEIVESRGSLRCPECRVLVACRVDELPPNVLLMRILEGMRSSTSSSTTTTTSNTANVNTAHRNNTTQAVSQASQPARSTESKSHPPHARALYDYISQETGDLSFKKGETILLHKRLDPFWFQGECSGRCGMFPVSYVQVIVPLPAPAALCKALFHFRMSAPDEEGCLAFDKGAIISVRRRVDDNWAEGRLGERVGIFPIAFVHLNAPARQLMDSPSLNRPVPPLPEPTRTAHSDHRHHVQHSHRYQMTMSTPTSVSNYQNVAAMSQSHPNYPHPMPPQPSTLHGITPGLLTRNIEEPQTKHMELIHYPNKSYQTVGIQNISRVNEGFDRIRNVKYDFNSTPVHNKNESTYQNVRAPASVLFTNSPDSSSSTSTPAAVSSTNTSSNSSSESAEVSTPSSPENTQTDPNDTTLNNSMAVLNITESSTATNTSLNVSLPSESSIQESQEASKNEPSRLEAPSSSKVQNTMRSSGPDSLLNFGLGLQAALSPSHSKEVSRQHKERDKRHSLTPSTHLSNGQQTQNRHSAEILSTSLLDHVPERDNSRPTREGERDNTRSNRECERDRRRRSRSNERVLPAVYIALYPYKPRKPDELELKKGGLYVVTERCRDGWCKGRAAGAARAAGGVFPGNYVAPHCTAQVSAPSPPAVPLAPPRDHSPNHNAQPASFPWTPQLSATLQHSNTKLDKQKDKSRSEKSGVSLMKRLAAMKKSKSPPPSYSIDNPGFEPGPTTSVNTTPANPMQAVHVRSGSCPSQLLDTVGLGAGGAAGAGSQSQRLRARDRPSVLPHHDRTGESVWQSHRKSQSLDVTPARRERDRHHSAQLKQRFRCIVPYPPNSELELELKVDDIVIVHRKRGDGWYKGTLQRTGRTGLFPASFVQSCPE